MADAWYAWSDLYLGGEYTEARDGRRVVTKRNVVAAGTKVSKASLKVSDDGEERALSDAEWDEFVDAGSVRPYPMPKMPEDYPGSPSQFVLEKMRAGGEDIDTNVLLGLALVHPDFGNPAVETEETAQSKK